MSAVFGHVNIVARDWRRLSRFYREVFGCVPLPPQRSQRSAALATGTGVPGASLEGEHLRLPGWGEAGPTLEIYAWQEPLAKLPAAPNRLGVGHLAFQVTDVAAALERVIAAGGRAIGSVVSMPVPGKGTITFVYAADPEDNILELQAWSAGESPA
jgi:catechol 2,3-dioxygenase-like lactoylglutathione lyase family enzyme